MKKPTELLSEKRWKIVEPVFPDCKRRKDGRSRPWGSTMVPAPSCVSIDFSLNEPECDRRLHLSIGANQRLSRDRS